MVEYYNNKLALEAGRLIDEGIFSETNYRNLTNRKKIDVVRRGCNNTPALVAFESLPERFRIAIEMKWGDVTKMVAKNLLLDYIIQDSAAIEFYSSYEIEPGRYLPSGDDNNVVREYYTNAIVLNAVAMRIMDKKANFKKLNNGVKNIWKVLSNNVNELDRTKYPHTLPANERRLRDRLNQFLKDGYESLIHKNFCNANSAKIDDNKKQAFIIELLADPRNLDNEQVAMLYNLVCDKMDWKKITGATVANWRKKYATEIYAGRRGSVAFRNQKTMQIKRSAPTAPLYYWTMDGWDVELLYQKFEDGRTTYHHRPTVVVILDAFCKYPIGYAVGTHETPELIKEALRNAAKHTKELFPSTGSGSGMYRSHQIQSDRYAIKTLTPYYEVMADKSTPARAKNAKAKIIEPYFNQINKKHCQLQLNWAGKGIQSKKESQPNNEFLNKYKKSFPEYEGVCQQVVMIMEREREEKRAEMIAAWATMGTENKLELSLENYLLNFGETKGKPNQREHDGLHKTINGVKYTYDCFDANFRNYDHLKFDIYFDPADMSKVVAANADKTIRFLLEEKYVQPMALKDRKVGDSGQIQRVNDFNADLEKQITDKRAKNIEAIMPILEILPQLDTLHKLMLTDSKGQHKDRRNDGRKTPNPLKGALKSGAVDVETEEVNEFDFNKMY